MPHKLDDAERRAWLRLARTEHVGPVTFANLIARFGSARYAIENLPQMARRGGSDNFILPPERDIDLELERLAQLGGRMIACCEGDFPIGLAALDPPPPLISVLGHGHLLTRDMIAVVGARNASALGRKFAFTLARELGEAGLAMVSGLARGIDAAAHEASLDSGTIAVVAGGLDIIYPPENEALYRAIAERGIILSEMRLGEAPQARHFPRRNRLISGLSRGVVVVEAAERSGSLITANYALEQGREIFAVPGSPLDPRAKGANRLIREGATLTESAEDVLAQIRPILGRSFREEEPIQAPPPLDRAAVDAEADRVRDRVIEALGPSPVEIDELIRQTGVPASAVLTVILELELAGRCRRQPGGRVSWA
jgi:DNA processing protein